MNEANIKFDRRDILVLQCIFAEAGKPRLSVKPRPVGGELHLRFLQVYQKKDEYHFEIQYYISILLGIPCILQ